MEKNFHKTPRYKHNPTPWRTFSISFSIQFFDHSIHIEFNLFSEWLSERSSATYVVHSLFKDVVIRHMCFFITLKAIDINQNHSTDDLTKVQCHLIIELIIQRIGRLSFLDDNYRSIQKQNHSYKIPINPLWKLKKYFHIDRALYRSYSPMCCIWRIYLPLQYLM
jgi:hypothetical protein